MGCIHDESDVVLPDEGLHRLRIHRSVDTGAMLQRQVLFTCLRTIKER